jgi:hypothetical protein
MELVIRLCEVECALAEDATWTSRKHVGGSGRRLQKSSSGPLRLLTRLADGLEPKSALRFRDSPQNWVPRFATLANSAKFDLKPAILNRQDEIDSEALR